MDAFIKVLAHIWQELILEVTEVVLRLNDSAKGILHSPGGLLMLRGDGLIVQEGLEHLAVFALKHHFELLPACPGIIRLFSINVGGF